MIDWHSILFNSFWIFGLALMLAAFSYNHWLAGQENRHLRMQLSEGSFRKPFLLALVLVGIGLVGTSEHMWEMVIWGLFTLIALIILFGLFR